MTLADPISHVEKKIYKNLVLAHRIHVNQSEWYYKQTKLIQLLLILTTISVFIVLMAPLDYAISWPIKFGIALLDLFLILYESGFRPEEKMQDNKVVARQLLPLKNSFAIAMSDFILGRIEEEQFIKIRNDVSQQFDAIQSRSPEVSRFVVVKSKKETRKYFQKNADYMIQLDENNE